MSTSGSSELLRAPLLHTPRNPFIEGNALEFIPDGGLLIAGGRIAACADYASVRKAHPDAASRDMRGGFLIPGMVDAHVHFPQLRALGGLGCTLLDWLHRYALPEEARMADVPYARGTAARFLHALASHGTTTALTFGAHFSPAMAALFEAAAQSGLRIISGLVLSDRNLKPELHQTTAAAYRESSDLIRSYHGRGRLLYAVTPRFAFSTSEAMLEVCQTLLRENCSVRFQTHINENAAEIEGVRKLFPWANDYFSVYERYGLASKRAVLAHNVSVTNSELERLSAAGASIAHCPCSNASLGSGIFPMRRHVDANVPFALGTDVGAGVGFGLLKEGLQAYLMQRVAPDGFPLTAAHLLYLATAAGAEALGLAHEIGDLQSGKAADIVYLRPTEGSPLAATLERADSPERILAALFTLAGAESVREVRVEGNVVYRGDRTPSGLSDF